VRNPQAGAAPDIHEAFQRQALVDAVLERDLVGDAVDHCDFVGNFPAIGADHGLERIDQDAVGRVEQGADIDNVRLARGFARLLEHREASGFGVEKADQFGHRFSPGEKKAPGGA